MRTTESIWAIEEDIRQPIRSMFRGLILERMPLPTLIYRLRNPMTRRVFDLPDSDDCYDRLMLRWYVSETRTFKVAFPSPDGKDGNGCFKILHVSVDDILRTIDFLFTTCKLTKVTKNLVGVIKGVYIIALFPSADEYDEPVIVCLEMGSEKMWRNNIPEHFCGCPISTKIVDWDGKPSLSRSHNGLLYVLVLEDYRSGKWADNAVIIDLISMDVHRTYYMDCYLKDNELHIIDHNNVMFALNIVTKVVTRVDTPKTRRHKFKGQPSLVDFKRMKTCAVAKPKLSEKFKHYLLLIS